MRYYVMLFHIMLIFITMYYYVMLLDGSTLPITVPGRLALAGDGCCPVSGAAAACSAGASQTPRPAGRGPFKSGTSGDCSGLQVSQSSPPDPHLNRGPSPHGVCWPGKLWLGKRRPQPHPPSVGASVSGSGNSQLQTMSEQKQKPARIAAAAASAANPANRRRIVFKELSLC